MKRTNNLIPTLIALTAACTASQSAQAQSPARQAFPWSSTSAVKTASPAVSQTAARVSASANHYIEANAPTFGKSVGQSIDNTIESATSIANSAPSAGYSIFLDERGNQITREQMQANLSAGQNDVSLGLPSANQAVQSFEQNFGQRITPLRQVDNSMWGKTKSMTSKMKSVWKKPSLFKTPEGMTLPSMKTTWAKPKFDEPTTWFSRKTTDPITFAPIDSLPRKGQIPTSTDGPLASQARFASRSAAPVALPSFTPKKLENVRDAASQSIFARPELEVAESVDNSFDPRR